MAAQLDRYQALLRGRRSLGSSVPAIVRDIDERLSSVEGAGAPEGGDQVNADDPRLSDRRAPLPGSVDNESMADVPEATFKLRPPGAGSGKPIDGTAAQARQSIGFFAAVTDISEAHVPGSVQAVRTDGYAVAGDGGGAHYTRAASEPAHAAKLQTADGAWWEMGGGEITPAQFGIRGDGSNETAKLQAMLNFAPGKTITWAHGKVYGYSSLQVPDGVTFRGRGATFRRLAPSTQPGFVIAGNFSADDLRIESPGGAGGDKAIRITGSNVEIGNLTVLADAEGVSASLNWAVEIAPPTEGGRLSRIRIGAATCINWATFMVARQVSMLTVSDTVIERYRTALYLIDVIKSRLSNFDVRGLSAAVNGKNGENALLLEATAPYACADLTFEDWSVADAGEHSYRLGGQQTIANVHFIRCSSRRSGSSILTGNLSSGEWHGGCGFKVLGGATEGGTRHKNIYFSQCKVFDVNQQFGAYPGGHGVNNFTPFLIVSADNVHLSGCVVDAEELSASCRQGLLVSSCDGVFVADCIFRKCALIAIKPYQEAVVAGYPGYATPIKEFHVRGGLYEVSTTASASGIVYYMQEAAAYSHANWSIAGAELRGGATAMRIEGAGDGSFANCRAAFAYFDPTSVANATAATPIVTGDGSLSWTIDITAEYRPLAYNIGVANGSTDRRIGTGLALRKSNTWGSL